MPTKSENARRAGPENQCCSQNDDNAKVLYYYIKTPSIFLLYKESKAAQRFEPNSFARLSFGLVHGFNSEACLLFDPAKWFHCIMLPLRIFKSASLFAMTSILCHIHLPFYLVNTDGRTF